MWEAWVQHGRIHVWSRQLNQQPTSWQEQQGKDHRSAVQGRKPPRRVGNSPWTWMLLVPRYFTSIMLRRS